MLKFITLKNHYVFFKMSIDGAENCSECGCEGMELPTTVEYQEQEIHLFNPVICAKCLLSHCEKFSVECANCGKMIPPYSQVGVLKGNSGEKSFVHMTTQCSTVGSAFHGYWGKGNLHNFVEVEAC